MKVKSQSDKDSHGVLTAKSQDIPESCWQLNGKPPNIFGRGNGDRRGNQGYKPQANLANTNEKFYLSKQILSYFY